MSHSHSDFSSVYSRKALWKIAKKNATSIGRKVLVKTLALYYCLEDKDTPAWAKAIIVGALGYLICPTDAIFDYTPLVGFSDDAGTLSSAIAAVAISLKKEHWTRAKHKVRTWFS